ncbi:unnamed protein product [Boreogadus saida]
MASSGLSPSQSLLRSWVDQLTREDPDYLERDTGYLLGDFCRAPAGPGPRAQDGGVDGPVYCGGAPPHQPQTPVRPGQGAAGLRPAHTQVQKSQSASTQRLEDASPTRTP